MSQKVDIVNLALQSLGTRTTVTAAGLAGGGSNEAIQANICYDVVRQDLLRMAPWDCGFNTATLNLITAAQGTPENTSPATPLWLKGQPAPPWAYEYQYPVDCLRACWIVPQDAQGVADAACGDGRGAELLERPAGPVQDGDRPVLSGHGCDGHQCRHGVRCQ